MTSWPNRFIALAAHVAEWSKDSSTRVGAVLVDPQKRVVSIGYNGPPRNTDDRAVIDRDVKLMRTLHAEENAILFARRDVSDCSLFTTHHPCAHCAAMIIQAGIKRVCMPPVDAAFRERWYESVSQAQQMFSEARVALITVWPEA